MLKVVGSEAAQDGVDGRSLLDDIAHEGARRMLVAALETEVAAHWSFATARDAPARSQSGPGRSR